VKGLVGFDSPPRHALARHARQLGGSIMAEDNLLLDLTPEEVSVMRQALRHHAEYYKRSDFKVLEARALELLNKVNDAILDSGRNPVTI
jgi:hypothetical protein